MAAAAGWVGSRPGSSACDVPRRLQGARMAAANGRRTLSPACPPRRAAHGRGAYPRFCSKKRPSIWRPRGVLDPRHPARWGLPPPFARVGASRVDRAPAVRNGAEARYPARVSGFCPNDPVIRAGSGKRWRSNRPCGRFVSPPRGGPLKHVRVVARAPTSAALAPPGGAGPA